MTRQTDGEDSQERRHAEATAAPGQTSAGAGQPHHESPDAAHRRRRLILRLVRFQNALDRIAEDVAEAYQHDRAFDAGEFSSPAIGRIAVKRATAAAHAIGFASVEAALMAARALDCELRGPR